MLIRALTQAARNVDHLRRDRLVGDQVVDQQRPGAEPADREQGAVQGQRRDDGVDAAAVGQAGVDHRAGLVHAPADPADDPLDDLDRCRSSLKATSTRSSRPLRST